ncbi:MAG: glutathione S-transferase family protein [Shimia sp.]
MYTLIGSPQNRAFRVIWMLEEIGVDYTLQKLAPQSEELRAHNPLGKMPVLLTDGVAIPDTLAIMHFLADKHSALTYPAGTVERAVQDAHTGFILDEMDSLLWTVAKHTFALPKDLRCPEVKDKVRAEYARSLERLEARIEGPYLMGDTMTVPDILAVHCLGWGLVAKFPPPSQALKDYSKGLRSRDAYRAAQAA